MPIIPSQDYLYSLSPPPAPRSPKRRRWVIAVVAAVLLLLLCLIAALSPLRRSPRPTDTDTDTEGNDTPTVTEPDDTAPPEEIETVDRYGFYEGNEVIVGVSGYEPDFPQEDCDYEKTAVEYYYDYSGKLGKSQMIADDTAPATRQLAFAGDFAEQTLYYQGSYKRYYKDEQASYHLYADESGWYTYLFTVDGRFVEYDMPADGISPFEDNDVAIQVALDFLCSVGVEITDEYTCTVMERTEPGLFDTEPKVGSASRVIVTRNIGGMIGEGYIVYCGMSIDAPPEVIYSRIINPGMYEAFGYITEEQVEHTRRRLYEAIGLLEQDMCDSYALNPYYRELLVKSGGHLYLRVRITPVNVDPDYHGFIGGGICQMRIDP